MFTPFAFKSVSYKHENELRAVYWNSLGFDTTTRKWVKPPGLYVPVNLQALITDIVVSPLAPAWFAPLVQNVLDRYGFSFTITPSLSAREAVY